MADVRGNLGERARCGKRETENLQSQASNHNFKLQSREEMAWRPATAYARQRNLSEISLSTFPF
jgi:hypothetical protein